MDTNLTLDLIGLCSHEGVDVNQRVWYRDLHEQRAVFVENTPFYLFDRNDLVESQFCVVQLVEAGLATAKDVCNAFDISIRTFSRVRKLVTQGGIAALVKESRKGRRDSTKKRIPAIVRLYDEGKSSREIARLLGISTSTVLRVLKDQGVPLRGNNGQTLFEKSKLPTDNSNDQDETRVRDETSVQGAGTNGDAKGNDNSIAPQPVATDCEQTDHEQTDHEQTDHEQTDHEQTDCEQTDCEQTDHEQADHERSPMVSSPGLGLASPAATPTPAASVSAAQSSSSPPDSEPDPRPPVEATSIPYASPLDRFCLQFGLIDEAPVQFESAESVTGAGALLGLALLEENGLLTEARSVYGSLQKCWYGLRPTIWTLLVMAWLRIKKPEQIKTHDPAGLGRLLGLPRAPEVKTIRRKREEIADRGGAAEFHRRMAQRRAEELDGELFRLYIDGHVRVYYGKRRIGKTHVTRLNSWQRGETDYWVHASGGDPLLVVRDATNGSFTRAMRNQLLPEIRRVIGRRRVRVVFDRVGWCKELFQELLSAGFDFMTYRCHPYEPLEDSLFGPVTYRAGSEEVVYELAESKFEEEGWPPLRLIAVRRKDGGQTHIVASGRETWEWLEQKAAAEKPTAEKPTAEKPAAEKPAAEELAAEELAASGDEPRAEELAWGMFGRWTQENWFKYMMAEYDLDVLLEYTTEPDDPDREVPNPAWRKLDKEVASARKSLQKAVYVLHGLGEKVAAAKSGESAAPQGESCQSCGSCLTCKYSAREREVALLDQQYQALLPRRRETPQHIRLGDVSDRDVVKLSYESKLFSDTIKLSAYEIETRLYGLLGESLVRRGEEGRRLLRTIFANRGDLLVRDDELEVHFEQLSSPRYTEALMHLCESVNALRPVLAESDLRVRFHVKPRPVGE